MHLIIVLLHFYAAIMSNRLVPIFAHRHAKPRRDAKESYLMKPNQIGTKPPEPSPPDWVELHRIVSEKEAARLRGVSVDTLRRCEWPPRLRVSAGRVGYRLGDCLRLEAR
jgi:hypothetical protein